MQVSRERNLRLFAMYWLVLYLVSTRLEFMNGPATNYVFSHLASEFLAAFLTLASSHSLLFPFFGFGPLMTPASLPTSHVEMEQACDASFES